MKTVRRDDSAGEFFGLIAFERLVSTGVHQHLDTAFSYMLSGALTDYSGTARAGDVGINFFGSTHDAIAYQPTLMVSRLEGPVLYGADISHALHAGAEHGSIVASFPDMPPDLNISLESVRPAATWVPGVSRRLLFDYLSTRHQRRLIDLTLLPGAKVPRHRLSARLDLYLVAGDVTLDNGTESVSISSGGFASLDPFEEIAYLSTCGAHVLVWSEGPSQWAEGQHWPEFYGFDASYASPLRAKR